MKTVYPIAVLAALALPACAGGPRNDSGPAPEPAASEAELEALFYARLDSARMRFTDADVHFMTGMIVHHAQALVMSDLVPDRSADRAVRVLAARIVNAQQDEIALMQHWLGDRGQPVPEIHIEGTTLRVRGAGEHATHMPGMLTQAQIDELAGAQGRNFDRLFLIYMIQHHRGAVTMVHELFNTDGAAQDPEVFRLASDIQVDQLTEISRMQRMLEALESTH
jgi:uncharacterized protein (DUF305 family)